VRRLEAEIPIKYGDDVVEILGAQALLSELDQAYVPWAIVTPGTQPLVSGWLSALSLSPPQHIVTAEDVPEGKPNPRCYQLGKEKLGGVGGSKALVIEDAPAGIRAGRAAGLKVLAVATTHGLEELVEPGADWIVADLSCVGVKNVGEDGFAC